MKTSAFSHSTSFILLHVMKFAYVYGTPTGPSTALLSQAEQQEALYFVLNKTLASAFATFGVDEMTFLDDNSNPSILEIRNAISSAPSQTHGDFEFQLNRMLLGLFQDAHYRVEVVGDELANYQYLDLCLDWLPTDDGFTSWTLVNTCDTSLVGKGDTIISMGSMSADQIFQALKDTIPHENEYFLTGLPMSWLVREDFVSHFGLWNDDDDTVTVIIEKHDNNSQAAAFEVDIPLTADFNDADSASFVSYSILDQESTAIFKLDACIFNGEFVRTLQEFWDKVLANSNIDTVILDLRENRGGDFTVGPAFLQYMTADPYALFDIVQRQSDDFCLQVPTLCDPSTLAILGGAGVNVTSELYTIPGPVLGAFFGSVMPPYTGRLSDAELFILTSDVTFSSAHLLAGVIQQNGLGSLVGGPTGNTPSFWGNVLSFPVPNTHLQLFLTTSQSVLPGEADAVIPDVLIASTRDDIVQGRDAQLEWVLQHVQGGVGSGSPTDSTVAPSSAPSSTPTGEEDSSSPSAVPILQATILKSLILLALVLVF